MRVDQVDYSINKPAIMTVLLKLRRYCRQALIIGH
jgi:hypothetical protein